MPLVSYDAVKPKAQSIKEQVLKREMPPWPADPNSSAKFRNDPRLSQQDVDTLVAWVDAGAPRGNPSDLPPMPSFTQGWEQLNGRAPDAVVALPEYAAPATGEIPYIQRRVKVPFPDDKWIVAMQVLPGNNALVHHMAITEVKLSDGVRLEDLDALAGLAQQLGFADSAFATTRPAVTDAANPEAYDMLGVYTPGTKLEIYQDGSAKLLKGGKNLFLNFNIHYTATGRPEKDLSRLAIWFQANPPKHQIYRVPAAGKSLIANGRQLLTDDPGTKAEGTDVAIPPIPPYTENYELIGITAYTEPVTIYQFQPHAHMRGKDFKYAVVYADGREETVLTVPKYDFHWQLAFDLDTPLRLPAGSKLVVTAHYDNSLKNEHLRGNNADDPGRNCGPDKEAYFRKENQSWDEMFSPFIQYSLDGADRTKPTKGPQPRQVTSERTPAARKEGARPQRALEIVDVVGCLTQSSSSVWKLTRAGDPIVTATQSTSLAALKSTAARPFGNQQYQMLGVSVFNPEAHAGQKVAVKGVLIKDTGNSRLNVTSLQMVGASCS